MCCTAAAQSPYPVVRALQNTLDSLQVQDDFPGATAAVVLPDGTLHAAATGYADREEATRMPLDARMLSGSTGKSFAAAVVLALAQEGRLDLDAPIARWLGDRPWFGRLPNADALTLRHLLRHQSGLRDHIHDDGFLTAVRERMETDGPDVAFAPEELVAFVLDAEPLFTVGAGYHYSDTNYILAGLIIEEVTDSTYYDVLQERLLTPLRLTATAPADRRDLPGLVAGYVEGEAPFGLPPKVTENGTLVYNPATEWTGGGLITSASDLARWAHRLYTGEALPGDYLSELLAAVPKDPTQQARFGADVRYGLGVTIRSTELGTAYGHRGWTPGYLSIFEYYPAHEVAVAVQVNALGPYELSRYAVHLAQTVRAADE
jgi:D-alanyl-D-alanine carboxypeptidase